MANDVFANGREVSCKKADGKSICAFPDVCFTPPENPATPPGVPVPYPNTGMAKDMTSGSKSVKISGKEVMLKNKSYFKKSIGDEAGSAAKKGVVSSVNRGKVYFTSWSIDVKFEGENVVRHLDLTTHNHASPIENTPPQIYQDLGAFGNPPECKQDTKEARTHCLKKPKFVTKSGKKHRVSCSKKCKKAMQCILVPKRDDKTLCCSPDNTGHHLIEDHWVRPDGVPMPGFLRAAQKASKAALAAGRRKKDLPAEELYDGAPTVCVNKQRFYGKHGKGHGIGGVIENSLIGKDFNYGMGKKIALREHNEMYPKAGCTKGCIEAQLDAFYGKNPKKKLHTPDSKQSLKPWQERWANTQLKKTGNVVLPG